ncbi:MAG TPA: DUF4097 family beta strand repeat-containing protein [Thermoanaerobaculia bacterium]|nr:DUF4097 family beta strand repeat-containing protein [Thermoanaerobaculia bacterium]
MKKLSRLPLMAMALLLGACVVTERHNAAVERTWPAAAVRELRLEDANGSVSVSATTDSEVTLRAVVRAYGMAKQAGQENDGYFDTTLDGDGTLRIGARRRKVRVRFPFFSHTNVHIDYEIGVPRSMPLHLKMVNGKVTVRGIAGETEVVTVNGPIDVEAEGTSQVFAKTVNGRVRAVFLTNFSGASLKTVNGPVQAFLPTNASFTCSLSQVNGDFEASSAFPLTIHSHPGSRRVSGEVNGGLHSLRITTVNGSVEVQQIRRAPAAAN